ncbi:NAD(P)/FAD-dependent oxidoreductase [Frigoriglobus tundricola]|uniref:D-amino acid dehydrogenase n=1 Tax=Frigoriglobus tundricola TaxID=2774151 RepID=A0A6M5Z181_9BACT|nr:FAD-dependent oxidoreductase [Frigoriglobus tundricola]QJW99400.1 D-amino acid dehydrogenase [Frigoriglobus tundricola]
MSRVVVVGGGVVGACCAYYLSKAGHAVTVLDRGQFGSGCSHANCGYICPSHVLPFAAPGAIWSTLKTLFKRNSPLKVRPGVALANLGWFLNFARRCNTRDMMAAGRGIQALLNSSRTLFDELIQTEQIACEWETKGLLFVFQTPAHFDHYAPTDAFLTREFAMPAKRFDSAALAALEPALKPGLAGGYLYESDAHLRPDRLMSELRRVLLARGVEVRENCAATGFEKSNGVASAVRTATGAVPADQIVVATGAWTPLLNEELGCRVPIQPGKGYSLTMPRPAVCPTYPLIFEEHRVAVTPFASGYRLGSTMEFAGYDESLNRSRLGLLTDAAKLYLRDPFAEPVQEEWWGWRPMTFDGLPVIDRAPAANNVLIAAGHNMLGLSMATATGKLVAELLGGGSAHIDPAPYSLKRL